MDLFKNRNNVASRVLVVWLVALMTIGHADKDDSSSFQLESVSTCNRMEVPGYPNFYTEMFGFFWDTLQCPGDLVFDPMYCGCTYPFNMQSMLPVDMAPAVANIPRVPVVPQPVSAPQRQRPTSPPYVPASLPETLAPPPRTTTSSTTSSTTPTATSSTTSTSPTTTTTAAPIQVRAICSGCRFDGGVGYKSHERDCDKYVMCSPSGVQGSLKADVRGCGVGEYWDQSLLTCRLSTDVPCPTDKCRARGNWYTYSYQGDCRAYWKCENGVSVGRCCPRGQGYMEGVGCLRNPSCNTNCGLPHIEIGCIKKPVPGNPRKFRQTIEGHGVIDMDCAGGTVFNPDTCDCQTDQTVVYKSQACRKELDISFTPEVKDVSGKNIHVNGINVTYDNGAVCFHGDGAVVIPRFANAEIGKTLDISLRFKSSDDLIGNELQAVVYNGDCGMDPSVVVAISKDKIVFTLRNKSNRTRSISLNMPIKIDKWISGRFSLRNDMMSMTIDGRTEKKLFFGDIDRSRCGLKLGWGKQYESFVGCIDKMSVSFCQDITT